MLNILRKIWKTEDPLIVKLREMGCTNIKVEEPCWSFDQPSGRRWAGGVGAVRQYIESGGFVAARQRDPVRLSINGVPIWTDRNGG